MWDYQLVRSFAVKWLREGLIYVKKFLVYPAKEVRFVRLG